MTSSFSAKVLFESLKHPENIKIAVIGLGYVGLPLAVEFAKKYDVLGFDINEKRVDELNSGYDVTKEADLTELLNVIEMRKTSGKGLQFSSNKDDLKNYVIFIITVPTPINRFKSPDLTPLLTASATVARVLK